MNNIIDISDRSPGSHLDLFNDTHQEQIIKALSIEKLEKITAQFFFSASSGTSPNFPQINMFSQFTSLDGF